jgi:hypothetical protein
VWVTEAFDSAVRQIVESGEDPMIEMAGEVCRVLVEVTL